MDFVSDWVIGPGQKSVRFIHIMEEGSRLLLRTEAHTSISSRKLSEVIDQEIEVRSCPAYLRCDNGPESISHQLSPWAADKNVELPFIQPGIPSQNGLIERLNKTLMAECRNLTWLTSMDELNEKIQNWSQPYNPDRPHESLDQQTPE